MVHCVEGGTKIDEADKKFLVLAKLVALLDGQPESRYVIDG